MPLTLSFAFLKFTLLAYAVPFGGQQCVTNSYTQAWKSLVKNVAIDQNDRRYGILSGGPALGMSAEELQWLRQTTGEVRCANSITGKFFRTSGSIVGKNDRIITNAHIFFQDDVKAQFDTCTFTTRTDPPKTKKLKLNSNSARFGTEVPGQKEGLDHAIVKLESPFKGVRPIPITNDPEAIKVADELTVLSAQMARMTRPVGVNEPIIQKCFARQVYGASEESSGSIYSDCSGTGGGPGSVNMVRGQDGQLYAVGISTGSGDPSKDYQVYSYEENNFSRTIKFGGKFKADISSLN